MVLNVCKVENIDPNTSLHAVDGWCNIVTLVTLFVEVTVCFMHARNFFNTFNVFKQLSSGLYEITTRSRSAVFVVVK